jgi:hypothetical protein
VVTPYFSYRKTVCRSDGFSDADIRQTGDTKLQQGGSVSSERYLHNFRVFSGELTSLVGANAKGPPTAAAGVSLADAEDEDAEDDRTSTTDAKGLFNLKAWEVFGIYALTHLVPSHCRSQSSTYDCQSEGLSSTCFIPLMI